MNLMQRTCKPKKIPVFRNSFDWRFKSVRWDQPVYTHTGTLPCSHFHCRSVKLILPPCVCTVRSGTRLTARASCISIQQLRVIQHWLQCRIWRYAFKHKSVPQERDPTTWLFAHVNKASPPALLLVTTAERRIVTALTLSIVELRFLLC